MPQVRPLKALIKGKRLSLHLLRICIIRRLRCMYFDLLTEIMLQMTLDTRASDLDVPESLYIDEVTLS